MKKLALVPLIFAVNGAVLSQTTVPGLIGQGDEYRTITTAVPFLTITPDSRSAALGDAGVATAPDVNSAFWNPAKMVFNEQKWGIGLSYTPWLAKIINDMHIAYLSGYYKISRVQTVSASMKYFDMGEVDLRSNSNEPLGVHNPRDAAFDISYSRLLTENLSIGGAIRYIQSNLIGSVAGTGTDAKPGRSVAVDLGMYYTKPMVSNNSFLSLGAAITNIGAKISYTDATSKNFIPANLRLGGAYKIETGAMNSFTIVLDFNKLLVPSPDSTANQNDKTLLSGIIESFSDAEGGFSEEIHEIMASLGVEYWYNNTFAGRLGYFNEAREKGNRKYLTFGVGFKKNQFGVDVAYMVPMNKRENALAETLRLTLHFIPRLKDVEESVNQ